MCNILFKIVNNFIVRNAHWNLVMATMKEEKEKEKSNHVQK